MKHAVGVPTAFFLAIRSHVLRGPGTSSVLESSFSKLLREVPFCRNAPEACLNVDLIVGLIEFQDMSAKDSIDNVISIIQYTERVGDVVLTVYLPTTQLKAVFSEGCEHYNTS